MCEIENLPGKLLMLAATLDNLYLKKAALWVREAARRIDVETISGDYVFIPECEASIDCKFLINDTIFLGDRIPYSIPESYEDMKNWLGVPDKYEFDMETIKKGLGIPENPHVYVCDFQTVIMRTGCMCGGI